MEEKLVENNQEEILKNDNRKKEENITIHDKTIGIELIYLLKQKI